MIRELFGIVESRRRVRLAFYLFAAVVYGVLAGAAMGLLLPLTRSFAADDGTAGGWLAALSGVVAGAAVLHYVQTLAMNAASLEIVAGMHRRAADALVDVPLEWCTRERAASVADTMISGTTVVGMSVAHLLSPVLSTFAATATVAIVVAFADAGLAVALVIGALVVWGAARWSTAVIDSGEQATHTRQLAVQEAVLDFARHQPVLRSAGVDARAFTPVAESLDEELRVSRGEGGRATVAAVLSGVLVQTTLSAVIVLAIHGFSGNRIDGPTAFAVIALAARFTGPITELVGLSSALRVSASKLRGVREILDAPSLPDPVESAVPEQEGTVEFRDVTFGYHSGLPVLEGVDFRIAPGEVVGIVGPSGCGKTTALKLIARFVDVESGSVRVAGHDVRHYNADTLMAQLSVVFQDVYLFEGTLRDNIAVGRPDASETEILAAAHAAGVDEIAGRLDGGFDAPVGEGGGMLSGGERQRISIARALLKDAPIVLLDEATASLDAFNEQFILDGIAELARSRTVIMIAHRASALRHCDRFIVFDGEGGIDAVGDDETLREGSAVYRRFLESTESAAGWSI
ncbi:ABC transporter ATP-binding protein/permease [Corynebacterium sp. TAE3-ERU12]|uniref:ABC transporter ATP-binding protein n=1 Tax=Corynebacterium sp. TAE3-ERU12 TaxID=2849491 RepID=UPI001C462B0D|nr:ABC transporter ATP-binding protein [Corynebacterium sp. TAE3-ERU12]MBV7294662.1 ABC transporter ATP-binding protein/permease [Corynebacterium sp. TAE3-ERU12]